MIKINDTIHKFLKFSIVGFVNTAGSYLIFFILLEIMNVGYLLSSILSYIVSIFISYIGNKYWTFKIRKTMWHIELTKFLILNFVGLAINSAIMVFLVEVFKLHPLIAQVIAMSIVIFYNFLGSHYWVFKEPIG